MLLDPRPHWRKFCEMLGLIAIVDDPRFAEEDARIANSQALIPIIQAKIEAHEWAYWRPLFDAFDAPWELIKSIEEVIVDPTCSEI